MTIQTVRIERYIFIKANMEINNKDLLNSAERIVRSQRQRQDASTSQNFHSSQTNSQVKKSASQVNDRNVRMLKLQAELRNLQASYTREQMRESYIKNSTEKINSNLKYEGKSLFPEYTKDTDLSALEKKIHSDSREILHNLKSLQVEIENLYALNFEKLSKEELNMRHQSSTFQTNSINPSRVAELTR